ncbi:DUF2000 domain-containing protein [Actinocorallia sp. B10E7]|uniref:DUF2000 domain-containing protein n=1 Tax=Actinocorallia sp. B10E7 TaxID=3153558 RepID=UPI00325F27DE
MKFVVALNRSYELSRLASGLGHVTAGLVAGLRDRTEDFAFGEYISRDGQVYPWISDAPFIVLKGRGGQLKSLRGTLNERGLPCVAYLDTMLSGGASVQKELTAQRAEDEIQVLAVATFGPAEVLNELTKKFSLWQ